jgi:hypothetical protein
VEEVIKNYKKYFNEGASGKRLFCWKNHMRFNVQELII